MRKMRNRGFFILFLPVSSLASAQSICPAQQQTLFANTASSISGAPREIQLRHIRHCLKADPAYGEGIAKALGRSLSEVHE
ncbi:catalase-related domain-containing protein [Nitrosomonas sp. sh817]|uniref:catalase-related domain-containing protein n=1 Tax=Nitrosomonas sp. sh817 TaxID=3070658 RepID=UPI0027DDFD6A|nr:catalase-related domain-containing protein [Nitrosomonas sp. sh817]WMJ09635.1 catalase-related domain-containing protein [Nitrosomonas sp. sh817]